MRVREGGEGGREGAREGARGRTGGVKFVDHDVRPEGDQTHEGRLGQELQDLLEEGREGGRDG